MKTNIKQTVGEKKRQESKNKHRGGNMRSQPTQEEITIKSTHKLKVIPITGTQT